MITTWRMYGKYLGWEHWQFCQRVCWQRKHLQLQLDLSKKRDLWSQNTIKQWSWRILSNQDKDTPGAGYNVFENFRTTERSGTMDSMIQVIYVLFIVLGKIYRSESTFCLGPSLSQTFCYRINTLQESADLQDSSGGTPYYRFHLINISQHFLHSVAPKFIFWSVTFAFFFTLLTPAYLEWVALQEGCWPSCSPSAWPPSPSSWQRAPCSDPSQALAAPSLHSLSSSCLHS